MLTAYDILLNVKEMFREQGRAARQVAMKALLNTKMAEGSPVQEHALKILSHLNELEVLGAEVDGKTQIEVLGSPKSFSNFRLTYNMSKSNYSLAELLKELRVAKGIIRHKRSLHVMEKGSFSSAKKKKKKKVPKQDAKPKQQQQQKPKEGDGKPKGKCFTCDQKGHYKNNCPKKPQSQNGNNSGMPHAYAVETYLVACTTGTWCVDIGATNHVCNSLQGF